MPPFFFLILGRYFSHNFEFTSEERTFSPSCSYFLSPTCSLLPPSLVVCYCFLVSLFLFLWCPRNLTSCWVFLGPLAVVSECSLPLPFSYSCFSPLFLTSFIFLSELYVSLSLSLHPYFDLENNMGFHWEHKIGPNIFRKCLEVLGGFLFIPELTFFVGTLEIFSDDHSLVVSCRPSQHMHLHLLWAVCLGLWTAWIAWAGKIQSCPSKILSVCTHMWFLGEMWTLCTSEELIRTLQDGASCSRHCYIKQLIKMITAQG